MKLVAVPLVLSIRKGGLAALGVADRHLGGANLAFADGHVKWFKSATPTSLAGVYNGCTPGAAGGSVPTFCINGTAGTSGGNATYNPSP